MKRWRAETESAVAMVLFPVRHLSSPILQSILSIHTRSRIRSSCKIHIILNTQESVDYYLLLYFSYPTLLCAENRLIWISFYGVSPFIQFLWWLRSLEEPVIVIIVKSSAWFVLISPNISSCGRFERSNQIRFSEKNWRPIHVRSSLKSDEMKAYRFI